MHYVAATIQIVAANKHDCKMRHYYPFLVLASYIILVGTLLAPAIAPQVYVQSWAIVEATFATDVSNV